MSERNGKIWIEYMPIDQIKRAKRNPKGHDQGEIRRSIERFGYITPMLIDEGTGRLVAGEGRLNDLQMAKARGEEVPERVEEREDGKWYAPVIRGVRFRDEGEAEAYLIADNRLSEIGGWENEGQLAEMLSDLAAEEKLGGVGYDGDDIDEIWKRLKAEVVAGGENERTEERREEVEEEIGKWEVEEGDVWVLEGVGAIICGDCREGGVWEKGLTSLTEMECNGVITSPPYAEQRKREYGGVEEEEYGEWWEEVQEQVKLNLARDGSFFVNLKAHSGEGERSLYVMELVMDMKRKWGWAFIDEFCWLRNPPPGSWPNRFKNGFEPVYQFALQPRVKFRPDNVKLDSSGKWEKSSNVNMGNYWNTADTEHEWDGSYPSNVLDIRENAPGIGHVAAFPVKLPKFFIKAFSDERDLWVDPFMGSGSTFVACLEENRRCLGIEKEPKYVAMALERLAKMAAEEGMQWTRMKMS